VVECCSQVLWVREYEEVVVVCSEEVAERWSGFVVECSR